LIFKEHILTVK